MTGPQTRPRVLVLRPERQAEQLADLLRALGMEPVVVPAVEIVAGNRAVIVEAVRRLSEFDWLVFTSVNGVEAFFESVHSSGLKPRYPKVAAIGPATAGCLEDKGIAPVWVPSRFTTAAIGEELPQSDGNKVLLVRAGIAGNAMEEALEKRGFSVQRLDAYTTAPVNSKLMTEAAAGVDAVAFTSASIVRSFAEAAGPVPGRLLIFSIGPATTQACTQAGLRVDSEAAEHTVAGLAAAIGVRILGSLA